MKKKVTPSPRRRAVKGKVTPLRGVRSPKHARHDHIGKLLLLGSRVFEHFALEEWRALGVVDLRLAHLALIRALPAEGRRTTEIAELAGMTKQAVGQLDRKSVV